MASNGHPKLEIALCKFLPYLKGSREPGLWEIGTATVSQPQSRSPKMSGRSRPSTKTLVKNFPYSKTEEPKNELKAPASPEREGGREGEREREGGREGERERWSGRERERAKKIKKRRKAPPHQQECRAITVVETWGL